MEIKKTLQIIIQFNPYDYGRISKKIEPFEPTYTEYFRQYIEKSIAESKKADAEANRSAAKIVIT